MTFCSGPRHSILIRHLNPLPSLFRCSNLLTVASSTSKGALLGVAVGLVFPPLALPLGVVGWLIGGAVGGIVGGTNNIYAKSVEVSVRIVLFLMFFVRCMSAVALLCSV